MEQSPSWEANRFSASQEIPYILWKPKAIYRIRKSPPFVPLLTQVNKYMPHATSWKYILILFSRLRLVLPSGLFPSAFSTKKLYACLLSPMRVTCTSLIILLDFITRIIFDEGVQVVSSSIFSFGPKCLPQLRILEHPRPVFPSQYKRESYSHIQINR